MAAPNVLLPDTASLVVTWFNDPLPINGTLVGWYNATSFIANKWWSNNIPLLIVTWWVEDDPPVMTASLVAVMGGRNDPPLLFVARW